MEGEMFVLTLLRAQIAAGLAVLAVLLLRGPVRRLAGPSVAYGLWALVPAAAVSSLFPTLAEFLRQDSLFAAMPTRAGGGWLRALSDDGVWRGWAPGLAAAWFAGAVGLALLFGWGEARFRRLARLGLAGPAVIGIAAPRLVTPHDYTERFTETERGFIRRHERAHMLRQDHLANLMIAVVQVVGWFNPLIHLAAAIARLDQEAACDAQVLEGRPSDRRPYAEALLKAHMQGTRTGALACAWAPTNRHPLELRLRLLARPEPSLRRYVVGVTTVGALAVLAAAAVWTLAPRQSPRTASVAAVAVAGVATTSVSA